MNTSDIPSEPQLENDVNGNEENCHANEKIIDFEVSDGSDIEIIAISENIASGKRKNNFKNTLQNRKRTKIYVNSVNCSMKNQQKSYIKEEIIISDGSDFSDNDCTNTLNVARKRPSNLNHNLKRIPNVRNKIVQNNESLSSITLNCPRCNKTEVVYSVTIKSTCKDCNINMFYVCTECNYRYETLPALYRHKKLQCKSVKLRGKKFGPLRQFFRKCCKCSHTQKEWRTSEVAMCPSCMIEMLYECLICNKIYTSYSGLYQHSRQQCQSSSKMYYCNDCNYKCTIQKFLQHHVAKSHASLYELQLSCPKCNKIFDRKYQLKRHLLGCQLAYYCCKFCSYKPKFLPRLKRHLLINHVNELQMESIESLLLEAANKRNNYTDNAMETNTEEEGNDLSRLRQAFCSKCKTSKPLLPGKYTCVNCNSSVLFKCARCSKHFHSQPSLYRHIRRQHGKLLHTCKNCGRSFSFYGDVNEHRKICGKEPRYHCEICYFKTRYKYNLRCHMDKLHNENRISYTCAKCNATYKFSSTLKKHQKTCRVQRKKNKS